MALLMCCTPSRNNKRHLPRRATRLSVSLRWPARAKTGKTLLPCVRALCVDRGPLVSWLPTRPHTYGAVLRGVNQTELARRPVPPVCTDSFPLFYISSFSPYCRTLIYYFQCNHPPSAYPLDTVWSLTTPLTASVVVYVYQSGVSLRVGETHTHDTVDRQLQGCQPYIVISQEIETERGP